MKSENQINKILLEFRETISKNGKIISTRLSEKYFINSNKEELWDNFIELTKSLEEIYPEIVDRLVASEQSITPLLCVTCNSNYRMVCRDDITYKKILSKYCCATCSSKSKQKVEKFKKSLSKDIIESAKDKRKSTMIEKYGKEYNSQRDEVKEIISKPRLDKNITDKLSNKSWLYDQYVTSNRSLSEIASELNVYYGTVAEYLKKFDIKIRPSTNNSFEQKKIAEFLQEENIQFEENNTTILSPKHLDFYLPKYNLAIEWNGNYYHEEYYRPDGYHTEKSTQCANRGIKLLHFYSQDMYQNFEIMKSIIRYHTIGVQTIYARKCDVKELNDCSDFLKQNHIQGNTNAKIKLGLFYENELVSVMTFGTPRLNKNYEWELIRFCNKINLNVVGGASKLLKYFEKKYQPKKLLSYCAIDRSNHGTLYTKLGFTKINQIESSYFYFKSGKIISRYSAQKQHLSKLLGDDFNKNETAEQNLRKCGWKKVYRAGNMIFEKIY